MAPIARYMPRYLGVFSSFLLAEDDLARERALAEAGECGKSLLADGPALDHLVELHGHAQRRLVQRWAQAPAGTPEHTALRQLAEGEATPLLLALILSHDLAQQAHNERRWMHDHGRGTALFEHTDDMIVVLGKQGEVDSVNPAYTRHTGWSPLQAATRFETMFPADLPTHQTQIVRNRQLRRDGSDFTVEWSISPIRTGTGEVLSHVCIGRDVTHHQKIEDGLRENDKLRAVATLAGGMAHDFNNLLGSITGLAELCELQAEPGSRMARNMGRIRQAGDKAAALVRQMLDFSRQTPRQLQAMTASDMLANSQDLLRAALPPQIQLNSHIQQDGMVQVDLVQLEQVLLNLTRNSAQAMDEEGGTIEIHVDRAEPAQAAVADADPPRRHLRIRVEDDGCGMAPELLPRIFDPFFTTKPVGQGTGLGLAAVHGIVASHQGVIEVTSRPGEGTSFSIFLPLAEAQVAAASADMKRTAPVAVVQGVAKQRDQSLSRKQ